VVANKFVFLDFYVAALCNLGFTICGSYTEQVWPALPYIACLHGAFHCGLIVAFGRLWLFIC